MAGYPVKGKTMRSDTHLPFIPHEIIHSGILYRLPAKSLARFRCVSKLWNATIGDPTFVESHALRKLNSTSSSILAIYCYQPNDPRSCAYDFLTQDDRHFFHFTTPASTELVGHCNGLFCFQNGKYGLIILLNPCTGEFLDHPLPPPPPHDHPFISYGFGFDPSRNEYKAVQIVRANCSLYRCMVYTFGAKNNSWRDITVQVDLSCYFEGPSPPEGCDPWGAINVGTPLYVNATLFWFFSKPWLFMVFDLHSEDFRFFQGPIHGPHFFASTCFLTQWQGSMCLAFQNVYVKTVHLFVYNSSRPDRDGCHVKQAELPTKFIWKNGALTGDSILYGFIGEELHLYTEGLDGCFYDFTTSKLATKFPLPSGVHMSRLLHYHFIYHVENRLSLKTMLRSRPTKFCRHAGQKKSVPAIPGAI